MDTFFLKKMGLSRLISLENIPNKSNFLTYFYKLGRRQKTLNRSAIFSTEEKNEIKIGLTVKCMSPEHSTDETNDRESSDSDNDTLAVPKNVLKV